MRLQEVLFVLSGFTSGIAHKRKREETVVYKCNKRLKTEECTEECVTISEYSRYCKMYYRKQDSLLSVDVQKRKCKRSRMGCVQCKGIFCKGCWEEGYDEHTK